MRKRSQAEQESRNAEDKCSTASDEIQPGIVTDFNYGSVVSSVCVEKLKGRTVGELRVSSRPA